MRARSCDVGLNIDAEESERLDLSLDLLETLCRDPALAGWNGVGFVVQAYQKRACAVIDWIVELARATRRRIMLRLVKGAYWDSEIKRAQVEGLEGFSGVHAQDPHRCLLHRLRAALLAAPDAVFPQFATHNALTLATIHAHGRRRTSTPGNTSSSACTAWASRSTTRSSAPGARRRPCRVYAPVGSHETLLAYLVRRLLENGANTSFVNRIADASVPIEALIADPVAAARAIDPVGAPHPQDRAAARSLRAERGRIRPASTSATRRASPRSARRSPQTRADRMARRRRGRRRAADRQPRRSRATSSARSSTPTREDVERAFAAAAKGAAGLGGARAGRARGDPRRAPRRASKRKRGELAGAASAAKPARRCPTRSATCARRSTSCATTRAQSPAATSPTRRIAPLGTVVCISPWNFPIAIFTGQVAAALAAGNAVIAKPAEETPLIAAAAVRLMHEAGVPDDALILVARRRRGRRRR